MIGKLAFVAGAGTIGAVVLLTFGIGLSGSPLADAGHLLGVMQSTCGSAASAQDRIVLPLVAGEDSFTIDLRASVHYQPGEKAEVVITGNPMLLDHVQLNGGRLSLDCDPGWFASKLDVNVSGPAINAWTLLGSGDLTLSGIAQPQLQLSIRGSGDVAATGAADTVGLNISGSGAARLRELEAKSARIDIRGSGDAEMTAIADADVSIHGSGNVELSGQPVMRRSEIRGSGRIVHVP
jgi:Putative auto-transporter adhesin, head GIN domain